MKTVKIATLKNSLSLYLSHVREGGDVIVLDRETPIARIVPFTSRQTAERGRASKDHKAKDEYWTEERLGEMERHGIIRRGSPRTTAAWLKDLRPVKLPPGVPSAVDLLLQMRRESTR